MIGTGYNANVPCQQGEFVYVRTVTYVDNVTPPTFTLSNDPTFISDDGSTLVGCFLVSVIQNLDPTQTTYQITDPHLILYVSMLPPDEIKSSTFLMPICQPVNLAETDQISLDVTLKDNCKLMCMYTPLLEDSISILDNADKYRVQLDSIDTTTRDLQFLSPSYEYINFIGNYGLYRTLARIKDDPETNNNVLHPNQTRNLAFVSQAVNGNKMAHIDIYSNGIVMDAKIGYIYQFIEKQY